MDIKLIEEKLSVLLKALGYELYSISYRREKGENNLYVVVDKDTPIDLNAISDVSEKISSYLDEIDAIDVKYNLDVSSLGAEKPLKLDCLDKYLNSYVNVHLINPVKGENIIEGTLKKVDGDNVTISLRNKTRVIDYETTIKNISSARLAIRF